MNLELQKREVLRYIELKLDCIGQQGRWLSANLEEMRDIPLDGIDSRLLRELRTVCEAIDNIELMAE